MDERIRKTLEILYHNANKNDFKSVVADIGILSDERRIVCSLMKEMGLITKTELLGKSSVRCDLTEKAVEYCKNNKFN